MNLYLLVYFHMANISFRKTLSLLGLLSLSLKESKWDWRLNLGNIIHENRNRGLLQHRKTEPSSSDCWFKGCEQLSPHFCPEALFCMCMSLECVHWHQWSVPQDYPKQCALRQYLWWLSSLSWGRYFCNEFLIWGYFSFLLTGRSFAEKVWIHCWGDTCFSLYVFGGFFMSQVLCPCKCFDL